jgi:hypothetical protein
MFENSLKPKLLLKDDNIDHLQSFEQFSSIITLSHPSHCLKIYPIMNVTFSWTLPLCEFYSTVCIESTNRLFTHLLDPAMHPYEYGPKLISILW